MKKSFLLYLFCPHKQEYIPHKLDYSNRQIINILKQTLLPQDLQYFSQNSQAYCTQETLEAFGIKHKISDKPPFIKKVVYDDIVLFYCTFCFQTHCGIYYFNFTLYQHQFKGRLLKILQNIQIHPLVSLTQEEASFLLQSIAPKRHYVNCFNLESIQKLLKKSFNHFVCLTHQFRHIPHIQELMRKNLVFDNPFFCYWFIYISNKDDNDTRACNLLLNQSVLSFCKERELSEKTHYFLNHQEVLELASDEIFEIGDGNLEVILSTFDFGAR